MGKLPNIAPGDPILTRWKSVLDPIIALPWNSGVLVKNYELIDGLNVLNHGLGRVPQGWIIADINGAAEIYRSAAFNSLTLSLTSNAAVTVSLLVF